MTGKKRLPAQEPTAENRSTAADQTPTPSGADPAATQDSGDRDTGRSDAFPIVGIGASAGGLEAFEHFFNHTPSDTGVAFVLIQHLDPTHKSILGDLIKRYTRMKVFQVEDGMKVEPNCTYIIPPNRDMAILHGRLHLIEPTAPRGLRLPIDFFFRSLAQDRAEQAICIVLSGTGTDGTLGLKAVKGEGGMTMVQSPDAAKYDGMPRSAINTGMVDYILPSEKMPEQLLSFINRERSKKAEKANGAHLPKPGEYLQKIYILIRDRTGHDFSFYKENTILRRIERRMTVNQIEHVGHYIRYLQQNPLEIDILFREFLIGVTNFFRDPEAFDVLATKVIPQILQFQPTEQPIRAWVTGCSTGEEAYTIAILLRAWMDTQKRSFPVQIFATDIDPEAIEVARAGIYPDSIAVDVPPNYLKQYFSKEENTYQVKKTIRDMLVFAVQSLIKDPPFSKLDLISCRNLLIYLRPELQQRLLPLFHYALNKEGYLLLGTSESVGDSADYFTTIDKRWKIFRKKGDLLASPQPMDMSARSGRPTAIRPSPNGLEGPEKRLTYKELAERTLLNHFPAGCIIINESGQMLFIYGRTGKYLEATTGEATLNILSQAREGLRIELTTAIRKVLGQKSAVHYRALRIKTNGSSQNVDLTVKPITDPPSLRGLMAVVIEDLPAPHTQAAEGSRTTRRESGPRVQELEQELRSNKEYLQSTIEELETANEELKSTNEELQSSNEELQSTNEELETSKEELQSVNEELTTVNFEHQKKIEELTQANNDINNLMAATEIGTLFLDTDLYITRFTPAVTQFINLIQTDVGRPLSHIVANLKHANLVRDAQSVLANLQSRELEIQSESGDWLLTRIMPYRTVDNLIQGVVITFVDITEQKRGHMALKKMELAIEQSAQMVVMTNTRGVIEYVNPKFCEVSGYKADEILGKTPATVKSGRHSQEFYRDLWTTILSGKVWRGEMINKAKTGELYYESASISPVCDEDGKITHFIGVMEDISGYKHTLHELSESQKQLQLSTEKLEAQVKERTEELTTANELLENVFSSIPIQIAQLDAELDFVRVNRAFAEPRKHGQAYFQGRSYFRMYPNSEDEEIFRQVLTTGESYRADARPTDGTGTSQPGRLWDWTVQASHKRPDQQRGLVLTLVEVSDRVDGKT